MFYAFQKQTEYGDIKISVATAAFFTTDETFVSLHGASTWDFARRYKKIVKQKGLTTEKSTDEGKIHE